MAVNKIARKDSSFRVVCILPDFCFVPGVAPPVPFPLFTDLGNAKTVANDVRINRKPAFVFNASKAPKTFGDQPGLRKGVISRTGDLSTMHSTAYRPPLQPKLKGKF